MKKLAMFAFAVLLSLGAGSLFAATHRQSSWIMKEAENYCKKGNVLSGEALQACIKDEKVLLEAKKKSPAPSAVVTPSKPKAHRTAKTQEP